MLVKISIVLLFIVWKKILTPSIFPIHPLWIDFTLSGHSSNYNLGLFRNTVLNPSNNLSLYAVSLKYHCFMNFFSIFAPDLQLVPSSFTYSFRLDLLVHLQELSYQLDPSLLHHLFHMQIHVYITVKTTTGSNSNSLDLMYLNINSKVTSLHLRSQNLFPSYLSGSSFH